MADENEVIVGEYDATLRMASAYASEDMCKQYPKTSAEHIAGLVGIIRRLQRPSTPPADAALADAMKLLAAWRDELLEGEPAFSARQCMDFSYAITLALDALRARAVPEDTVRLDFVIRDEALVASWSKLDGTTAYRLEWETGERQSEWYESPRAAIDARIAMLAASKAVEGG